MAGPRDLRVNFERMWREMDELLGDPFAEQWSRLAPAQPGFSPRVDVYYCGDAPRAVVKAELAGVDIDTVSLEVAGRELVITGERPVAETEGRVYQQVEIEAGPFRRVVELGADVVAERARASYEDGDPAGRAAARRPGDPPGADRAPRLDPMSEGDGIQVVEATDLEEAIRERGVRAAAGGAAGAAAQGGGRLPRHADAARGRPGALDQADRRRARRRAHAGPRRLARPRARRAGARAALRRRRRRRRRPHAQGPRRDDADPRPGDRAGSDRRLRDREALPGGADRGAARRGRAVARARGADPQRPAHLHGDHRADPVPARGAAARGHQHRRPLGARPPDRRRAADPDRREAGAARGGRRRPPSAPALGAARARARGDPARLADPVRGRVGDGEGPARVLPARAAEGDPARARRGGRDPGRGQRAARADRGGRAARGRPEGGRPRALAARAPARRRPPSTG